MLGLFVWVGYHQLMSTLPMDSMPTHQTPSASCMAYCFIATTINVSGLVQSIYYAFASSIISVMTLLAISVLTYAALYYLRSSQSIVNPRLQKLNRYYQQQRWRLKSFSLWSRLYQQGIIAPQVYS